VDSLKGLEGKPEIVYKKKFGDSERREFAISNLIAVRKPYDLPQKGKKKNFW